MFGARAIRVILPVQIIMVTFCLTTSMLAQSLQIKFTTKPLPGVPMEKGLVSKIATAKQSTHQTRNLTLGRSSQDNQAAQPSTALSKTFDKGNVAPAPKSSHRFQQKPSAEDVYYESGSGNTPAESTQSGKKEKDEFKNEVDAPAEPSSTQQEFFNSQKSRDIGTAATSGDFIISTGTQNYSIADISYRWVQLRTNATLPAGAQVTNVLYRLKIDDTGDPNTFNCGDYEIWLSSEANGAPNKYLRVYDNLGTRTDGGHDDDAEDNSDIYLNWRSTSAFNGQNPAQKWCVWVEDTSTGNAGELEYIEFHIYYESPTPVLPNLIANFTPTDWSAPIVASSVSGTHTDGPNLQDGATTFIDFAFLNQNVDVPSSTRFYVYLYDHDGGTFLNGWYWDGIQQDHYGYVQDYEYTFLITGTTTLKTSIDATGVINESNESDNVYSRQIGPFQAGTPDIDVRPVSLHIYQH